MGVLDRLLGKPSPPPPAVQRLARAITESADVFDELAEKLDADPCASDWSRQECSPEIRRHLRRHNGIAGTLLDARTRRSR